MIVVGGNETNQIVVRIIFEYWQLTKNGIFHLYSVMVERGLAGGCDRYNPLNPL